jgi:hypothetical protein
MALSESDDCRVSYTISFHVAVYDETLRRAGKTQR